MAKKTVFDKSLFIALAILSILIVGGVITTLSLNLKKQKDVYRMMIQSPSNQSDLNRAVLFIGYFDKKLLLMSEISANYLVEGTEPESERDSLLTLESYNVYNELIHQQPLPLIEEDSGNANTRKGNLWAVSSEIKLYPQTMYWQIRYNPTEKVIWDTNTHLFLLQQALSMVPVSHFVHENSKKILEDKIEDLEVIYYQAKKEDVQTGLQEFKELVIRETEPNALKTLPLQVDQSDFMLIVDDLLQGTKYY